MPGKKQCKQRKTTQESPADLVVLAVTGNQQARDAVSHLFAQLPGQPVNITWAM